MKSNVSGDDLPSPRDISVLVHDFDFPRLDPRGSVMLMEWGQFLAHDLTGTPVGKCLTVFSTHGHTSRWVKCREPSSFFLTTTTTVLTVAVTDLVADAASMTAEECCYDSLVTDGDLHPDVESG